jgi:hypothetical protein
MASRDHFQQELHAQIERAIERGAEQLVVNSGVPNPEMADVFRTEKPPEGGIPLHNLPR